MIVRKIYWALAVVLVLYAWPAHASSLDRLWNDSMAAGMSAYKEGDVDKALKQLEITLEIAEGYGAEHPNLATSLNNLASLYYMLGRYAAAEPLYRRALAIWRKRHGSDHPIVAAGLANLAFLSQAQGRHVEAEMLYRQALSIWDSQPGSDLHSVGLAANPESTPVGIAAAKDVTRTGAVEREGREFYPSTSRAAEKLAQVAPESAGVGNQENVAIDADETTITAFKDDGAILTESGIYGKIVGNTIRGYTQGRWVSLYFAPDGTVGQSQSNIRGTIWHKARWSVADRLMCFEFFDLGNYCVMFSIADGRLSVLSEGGEDTGLSIALLRGNPKNL